MKRWLIGIGLYAWMLAAGATEVSLNGYASAIGVWSENNGWQTPDTAGQWGLQHEAALSVNVRFSGFTQLTARIVSQGHGRRDNGEPKLDIFSLNHVFSSGFGHTFGVRLGRIKNTLFGLYSAQDIPSERPGVVPPIVYLSAVVPEVFSSMDGVQLYGSHWLKGGDEISWQLYAGQRQDVDNVAQEYYMFGGDAPGRYESVRQVGAKLQWVPAALPGGRFGVSVARIEQNWRSGQSVQQAQARLIADLLGGGIRPWVAPYLVDFSHDSLVGVLSAGYDQGRWSLRTELAAADFVLNLQVADTRRRVSATVYMGYVQLGWRPLPRWQLWARVGSMGFSRNLGVVHPANPYRNYAQLYTLAARCHLSRQLFVTAQATESSGTAAWPIYPGSYDAPMARNNRLYLLSLTWQF